MPRPEPKNHIRMPVSDRAAQFAPFAALTGYNAVIDETARSTNFRMILDDSEKMRINRTLDRLHRIIKEEPYVEITFFDKDRKKAGGYCKTYKAAVRKIDEYQQEIILKNSTKISFQDIIDIRKVD